MGQIIDCQSFFRHLQVFHTHTLLERRNIVEAYFQTAAHDLPNPWMCERLVAYGHQQRDHLWPVTVAPTSVPDDFRL